MKTFSSYFSSNNLFFMLLACASLMVPELAHAEGLDKVNDFMDNIAAILSGAAVITVTVAIMWAGYKFLFTNATAAEVMKIVIAGLLIGGAAEISSYLVG
ncbi:type IV secretion protein A [Vibrio parahaemolyticus]|uniref:TrbC/VirB2 family protein n=1 Tax=Vibrio harveyi group TaxID=717610 RepID=UPI001120DAF7|nr:MULTISPECIES: TrbC/VirB2 family protein [Vibrio harveyi group]EJG1885574.1 TrbC/VirB2 family protein [Vibrio parahaemolyticus]MCQ9091005.1 TrbC/VirB2 family protein [Vibrio alginolyticus]MDF4820349.1 TrbC/VirB2 family protein [Vibrio parahaemolyticus]TOR11922.1 type IV secretion protein A [Vibrio parahaemolyticus]UJW92771.1 TrbC/VirB2 family protein [Vibrio parahaemolyticus]